MHRARDQVLAAEDETERLGRTADLACVLVRLLGSVALAAYRSVGAPDPALNRNILTRLVHPGAADWHRFLAEILARFRLWEEFSDFPVPGLPEWYADPAAVPASGVLFFNLMDSVRSRAEGRGRGGGFRHVPPGQILEKLLPLAAPAVRQSLPPRLDAELNRFLLPFLDPFLAGIPGVARASLRRYGPPTLFAEREVIDYAGPDATVERGTPGGLARLHLEQEARVYLCLDGNPALGLHPWVTGDEQDLYFWDGLETPDRARMVRPAGGGLSQLEGPVVSGALADILGRPLHEAEVDGLRRSLSAHRSRRVAREAALFRMPAPAARTTLAAGTPQDAAAAPMGPEPQPAPAPEPETELDSEAEDLAGATPGHAVEVGDLRVLAEITHGKRGDVYYAVDPADGEEKAVQVLRARRPEAAREAARALDALRLQLGDDWPPDLCLVERAGGHEGRPYLVLPQIPHARPLRADLGEYGPEDAAGILAGPARALAALHARGLAHGDLSPDTVWVTPDGEGLLSPAALTGLPGCLPPRIADTLAYRAPECSGAKRPAADTRSWATDCYGLGCLLYAAVAGTPPPEPGSSLAHRVAGLPDGMDALVRALTQARPEDRPGDPRAVAHDLERLAEGLRPLASRGGTRRIRFAAVAAVLVLLVAIAAWQAPWSGSGGGGGDHPVEPGPDKPPVPAAPLDAQTLLLVEEGENLLAEAESLPAPERTRPLRSAVARFDAALARIPGAPRSLAGRGRARILLDLPEAGVDDLTAALDAAPSLTAPAFVLGTQALGMPEPGGLARARRYLGQAAAGPGDDPWTLMAQARLGLLDRRPAAAGAVLDRLRGIYAGAPVQPTAAPPAAYRDLAVDVSRALADSAPGSREARIHLDRLREDLEIALEADPDSVDLRRWTADTLFRLGDAGALDNFLAVWISRDTGSPTPFRVRGTLRLAMGHLREAAADLDAALQRGASDLDLHLARGEALLTLGLGPVAVEAATQALAAGPGHPEALRLLARATALDRRSSPQREAAILLPQARALPADPVGYASWGRLLVLAGDREGSDAVVSAVDAQARKNPLLGLALARLHADRGEWPEAELALRRHLEAAPTDWQARRMLGLALHRMDRAAEALRELEECRDRAPLARSPRLDLAVLRLDPTALMLPGFGPDHALEEIKELALRTPQDGFARDWTQLDAGQPPSELAEMPERVQAYAATGLRRLYERLHEPLLSAAERARSQGDVDVARRAYSHVQVLRPDAAPALEGLSWAAAAGGDPDLSMLYLERATDLGLNQVDGLLGSPPYRDLWNEPRFATATGRVSRRAGVGGQVARVHGADAALLPGDRVLSWNDAPVPAGAALEQLVSKLPAGREARLVVLRDQRLMEVQVEGGLTVEVER